MVISLKVRYFDSKKCCTTSTNFSVSSKSGKCALFSNNAMVLFLSFLCMILEMGMPVFQSNTPVIISVSCLISPRRGIKGLSDRLDVRAFIIKPVLVNLLSSHKALFLLATS